MTGFTVRTIKAKTIGSVIRDKGTSRLWTGLRCTALCAISAWLAPWSANAQTATRIAVVSANGPLERANPIFALGEDRVTRSLESKLAGQPGLAVVAQDDIQTILNTQNFQNSDRTSSQTAAQIGKIANAQLIVLVSLVSASQSSHQDNTPVSAKTIAVVQAETTARLVSVESGVNVATPRSTFEGNSVATEVKTFPIVKTTGPGLQAALTDLWTKATDSLTTDLATKLESAISQTPSGPATSRPSPNEQLKVLGIDSGSVFISSGSLGGVKVGDRFQIVRMVATTLKNTDGSAVTRKQPLCLLQIDSVSDKNASGKCPGGQPQPDDIAEPVP